MSIKFDKISQFAKKMSNGKFLHIFEALKNLNTLKRFEN